MMTIAIKKNYKEIAFFVILVFFILLAHPLFVDKFTVFLYRAGSLKEKLVYLSVFIVINFLYLFFLYALSRSRWYTKVIFLPLVFISTTNYIVYYLIDGVGITFFTYLSLRSSFSSIFDAISAYYWVILKAILLVLPLIVLIILRKPSPNMKRYSFRNILIIFLIQIFLVAGVIYQRKNGTGADGLPPGIITYSYEVDIALNNILKPKEEVRVMPNYSGEAIFQNIVLIVDESIHPYFLNNETVPDLLSIPSLINLGTAASYANCSQYSNILLRKAARYNMEVEDTNSSLYLWDLMKNADYNPVLIDAQGNGKNHNFFTEEEVNSINNIDTKNFNSDVEVATKINEIIHNGEKNFIYVIKKGAHFPYSNAGIELLFEPIMSSSMFANGSFNQVINSYKNLIVHNTNNFFKELDTDYPNTIFIYTSDHGQNLWNLDSSLTHCTVDNPDLNEGIVPLMLIGDIDESKFSEFTKNLLSLKPSHYLIPFFILEFAGYSPTAIKEVMGEAKDIDSFVHGNVLGFFGTRPGRTTINKQDDN